MAVINCFPSPLWRVNGLKFILLLSKPSFYWRECNLMNYCWCGCGGSLVSYVVNYSPPQNEIMCGLSAGDAVVYGNTIDVYTCVETLMRLGVCGCRIHVVHPPKDDPSSCFHDGSVDHAVKQALEKEEVQIHHDYLLKQLNDGQHTDPVTSVSFTTDGPTLRLECAVRNRNHS